MAAINIRTSHSEDCDEIMRMIQELADYENMPDGPQINCHTLKEDGFGDECFYKCIVAEDRETAKLVGYVLYFFTYTTQIGKRIYMEDLYVTPAYRKFGIGTNLWKAVIEKGLLHDANSLDFAVLGWNEPSINFYRKKGAIDLTIQNNKHLLRFSKEDMAKISKTNISNSNLGGSYSK